MDRIEEDLLAGIKSRDQKSFDYLMRLYFQPLLLYAQTIVQDPEVTRELIHDVFLKIWNDKSLHISTSVKAYLYRMIHNRCLDYLREKQQKKNLKVSSYDDDSIRQQTYNIESPQIYFDLLFSEEAEAALQKAIENLPSQCRQIFLLSRYENLSYSKISEKLHISVSTVKTQMVRAILKLKEDLTDFL